jgi:hypothetical protein
MCKNCTIAHWMCMCAIAIVVAQGKSFVYKSNEATTIVRGPMQ